MASINGYKFTTEQDAINARESVDTYYGIPVTPDDVTQNWVNYKLAELNTPQFWYINFNDSLEVVLREPTEFEVVQPIINGL
jgi:hypothetical protein